MLVFIGSDKYDEQSIWVENMAQRLINIGTGPNTKDGDTVRNAFDKVNQNFSELFTIAGETTDGYIVTDIKGSVFGDDSTAIIDAINGKVTATDITANAVSTIQLNTVSANIVEFVTTAEVVTNLVTLPNDVYTRSLASVVPANTPSVIWESYIQNITSAKLVIQIETSLPPDPDLSGGWHTQLCEANIVKRINFATTPLLSVYGINYTSLSVLATFAAQFNLSTNKMEIVATSVSGYSLTVKVFATEFLTSD